MNDFSLPIVYTVLVKTNYTYQNFKSKKFSNLVFKRCNNFMNTAHKYYNTKQIELHF